MKKFARSASTVAVGTVTALGSLSPTFADEPISFTISGEERQIIGSLSGEITPESLVDAMQSGGVHLKWIPIGSVQYLACNAPFIESSAEAGTKVEIVPDERTTVEVVTIPEGTVQYLACNAPFLKDK